MIRKLLIANRGEIARRIMRTCRRMGVETVAVYSEADAGLPFVREADHAVFIGPPAARDSYLVAQKILDAARTSGADGIHPGYGFLSENADFAEAVRAAGLVWVGAPPSAIRAMGLKDRAKQLMSEAGVPVTPGYLGEDQAEKRLASEAGKIGYPVLIKAVAGGGGKGMRKVDAAADFKAALDSCRREAKSSFGDERVLIEKYVRNPRHIEVQVFGDAHGNVVHLFERDCSLQRRHQKVIEEAPAPGMSEETRAAICEAAVRAARAVNYEGAGTIEFIADASEGLRADRIWFMEMNTRLQVEHPVTESITGLDLVEWQLRVASGEPLPLQQSQITRAGHAIEARLYAENPATGFLPSIGPLKHLHLPSSIRVDAGVEEGGEVSAHYDPMIAKLVAHEPTRETAAAKLAIACAEIEVWPVRTNAAFLVRALENPAFLAAEIDTGFIERHIETLSPMSGPSTPVMEAAARALLNVDPHDPWSALTGFRIASPRERRIEVEIAGESASIELSDIAVPSAQEIDGDTLVFYRGEAWPVTPPTVDRYAGSGESGSDGAILAPMPGRIVLTAVKEGDAVMRGQKLVTLEAMKMEHALVAPFDGVVRELKASDGAQVTEGALLVRIEHT
jgi:3-methylcrotonyl-CoA carboxylase alpha subunit